MSFSTLKKNSKASFEQITKEIEKLNQKSYETDKDEWVPSVDKAGNGLAILRFLPAPDGEDAPFVRIFRHSFKGPTGLWLIENCPTTIGKDCPVCKANGILWNDKTNPNNENIVRDRKRRLAYKTNIYLISYKSNKEQEGRVWKFNIGKTIYDILENAMNPKYDTDVAFNPFDFWTGANMNLKIRNKDGYRNYELSNFTTPAPLFKDDKQLEEVYNSLFKLTPYIAEDQFKSYDDIASRLAKVLGDGTTSSSKKTAGESASPDLSGSTDPDLGNSDEGDSEEDLFKKLQSED